MFVFVLRKYMTQYLNQRMQVKTYNDLEKYILEKLLYIFFSFRHYD